MRIPRWLKYCFVSICLVLASVNIATASTDEMDIHILQPHEYRSLEIVIKNKLRRKLL